MSPGCSKPTPGHGTVSCSGCSTPRACAYHSESYGDEAAVVRIHSGNGMHDEMDRRAVACFDQALADVELADDSVLLQVHKPQKWVAANGSYRVPLRTAFCTLGSRVPRPKPDPVV